MRKPALFAEIAEFAESGGPAIADSIAFFESDGHACLGNVA
jgi:hypothetical protein